MTQQEQIYTIASELATSKRAVDIKRAMDLFESIPEYEDASECAKACQARLHENELYSDYFHCFRFSGLYNRHFDCIFFVGRP